MLELQDLFDFSITSWYKNFKDVSLKTIIISLPKNVLSQLQDDGRIDVDTIDDQEFLNQVKNAIALFKNNAFVKSNWNAPMDSKFISFGNTLQVTNLDDLILYLTASEITLKNYENKNYNDYCIALRQWTNIHPASEFRCIVINDILRGITPRDWPTFYAHFEEEGPQIISSLLEFFKMNIQGKFCRQNYTFDVVLSFQDSIKLVDFGPLNNKANLYAYSWKEIQTLFKKNDKAEVPPVFRFLETDMGIMTKTDALLKFAQACD